MIGAGSIGARHTRNLVAAGAEVHVCDLDAARAERVAAAIDGAHASRLDLDEAASYDGVVVASPTSEHAAQLRALLEAGARHVLVEKPVATEADELEDLVERSGTRVAVAYNLRFHEPIERLVALVRSGRIGRVIGLRLWAGSYLPDWRPGVDYRRTYSARAELGGGVLLDAVHEIDLLLWLLDGRLRVAGAVVSRAGDLEIDVEDTVRAVLEHEDGAAVSIELDYVSRRYRRGIEAIGTRATARLDWARHVLEIEDATGVEVEPADTPLDKSYERQDAQFVAWVAGGGPLPVDAATGAAAVAIARAIRHAAEGGRR